MANACTKALVEVPQRHGDITTLYYGEPSAVSCVSLLPCVSEQMAFWQRHKKVLRDQKLMHLVKMPNGNEGNKLMMRLCRQRKSVLRISRPNQQASLVSFHADRHQGSAKIRQLESANRPRCLPLIGIFKQLRGCTCRLR